MQRSELRHRYNLEGSCLVDLATSCCCGCCSLIQQDKEAAYHEPLLAAAAAAGGGAGGDTQQYKSEAGMTAVPAPAPATTIA